MGGSVPTGVGTFATGVTSINGGRSDEFMTTIDGAPSIRVRAAGGFMMGAQNFDTVAEVQVLTTNYQAEYGRSSAGQLRMVTKSGTQSFRGNVFWSHQNDALDANTWTRKRSGLEKSPHTYNAYGFTLGGPIYIPGAFNSSKQNLFFFWGQEWQRDRTVEEQTAIVPTAAQRNGDFSGFSRNIIDPLTGQAFPGNVIPQGRISPQGRALLNAFPLPIAGFQQGANNWIGNPSVFNNQRKDSIKIDWVPTSNHRVAVRHTWAPNVWNDPEPMGVYSTIWDYPGRTMAATLTSTLSNSLINEFSFSWGSTSPSKYFGQRNCDYCPGGTDALPVSDDGVGRHQLSVSVPRHEARPGQDSERLAPGLHGDQQRRVPGLVERLRVPVGRQRHEDHRQPRVQGRHQHRALGDERSHSAQLRAGAGDDEPERLVPLHGPAHRLWGNDGTASPMPLLGLFDDYTEFGNKPNTKWMAMAYDFYAQDSWKPTRDLTLELGLRYSLWQPWGVTKRGDGLVPAAVLRPGDCAGDRSRAAASWSAAIASTASRCRVTSQPTRRSRNSRSWPACSGCITACRTASPRRPRTASSLVSGWRTPLNELTTFRAGVGRFLNRVQINTTAAYGFNAPLSEMQTVINGNVDTPGGASTRNFPLVGASQSPDFTNPTSWAWNATVDRLLPWQMRGALSYVGRSASHLERARNINQLAAGHDSEQPGREHQRAAAVSGLRQHHAVRDDRHVALQQPADAGRAARHARRRVQRRLHVLADEGRRQRARRYPAERLRRQRVLRHLGSRSPARAGRLRSGISFPRLEGSVAPLRWVFGNWDVSGIFQAQSGAPFDVRSHGVDRCGRRAGKRQPVLRTDRRSDGDAENRVGTAPERLARRRHLVRPAPRSVVPRRARSPRRRRRTRCASPASGTSTCRSARASTWSELAALRSAHRGIQHPQPHAPRKRRDQSDSAATSATSRHEGRQPDDAGRDAVHLLME